MATSRSFTSLASDKEKDEEWHKKMHLRFLSNSQPTIAEIDRYYENVYAMAGELDQDSYKNVAMTPDGSSLGVPVMNVNRIARIVRQFVGEVISKRISPVVKPKSRYAINQRYNEILIKKVQYRLAAVLETIQAETGIPVVPEGLPQSDKEMAEYERNYKDMGSIIYGRLIGHVAEQSNIKMLAAEWAKDMLLAGRAHSLLHKTAFGVEVHHGKIPSILLDRNTNPDGSNLTWWGYMDYLPVQVAMRLYNIPREEIERMKAGMSASTGSSGAGGMDVAGPWGGVSGGRYPWIISEGEERILISATQWIDVTDKVGISSINKRTGEELYTVVDGDTSTLDRTARMNMKKRIKKAKHVDRKEYGRIRGCVMAGNSFVAEYGVEDGIQSFEDWTNPGFAMTMSAPLWEKDYGVTPIISEVLTLNKIIIEAWHKIRVALKQDVGDVIPKDMAMQDPQITAQSHDYIMRALGKYLYNSYAKGIPLGTPQISAINLGIKNERVNALATIIMLATKEIETVTGFSGNRMAETQAASTKVGVNDATMVQSQLQTMIYSMGIEQLIGDTLTKAVNMMRPEVTSDPEKWGHIIGDDGVRFLQETDGMDMADFGIYVDSMQIPLEQKQAIFNMISASSQSGQLDPRDALTALLEENIFEARDHMINAIGRREKQAQQQQQQQAKMMQDAQMAQAQTKEQANQVQMQKAEGDQEVQKQAINAKMAIEANKQQEQQKPF